jgi:hypothetical protein
MGVGGGGISSDEAEATRSAICLRNSRSLKLHFKQQPQLPKF